MTRINAFLCLGLFILASSPAQAGIMFDDKGGGTGTNLLFEKAGITTDSGPLVNGVTNTPNFAFLDITSAGFNLQSFGSGAARVERVGGGQFGDTSLVANPGLTPPGFTSLASFTTLILDIQTNANGTVQFTAFTNLNPLIGVLSPVFPVGAAGSNFFRVDSDSGEVITRVDIDISGNIIDDIRQIRLDGLSADPNNPGPPIPVPEPTTLALWGVLGAGLAIGSWVRRKRSASSTAI